MKRLPQSDKVARVDLSVGGRKKYGSSWGREVRLRWSDVVQSQRATVLPAVHPTVVRNELGNVVVILDPVPAARRRGAYAVRASETAHSGMWWGTTFVLFEDDPVHAAALKLLPPPRALAPATHCMAGDPPTLVVLLAKGAAPQPTRDAETPAISSDEGATLPFDEKRGPTPASEVKCDTGPTIAQSMERAAWAQVKLYKADTEDAQRHRAEDAAARAQHMASTEEFRAQVLRDSKHQTEALCSIATSLTQINHAIANGLVVVVDQEQELRLRDELHGIATTLVNSKC